MIPLKYLSTQRPVFQKYASHTKHAEMIKRLNAAIIAKLPVKKLKR